MKKSMTVLSVVILMVCFAFLMLAGCDDDYHGGREFRTRRNNWEVHRVQDRSDYRQRDSHRGSRRRGRG